MKIGILGTGVVGCTLGTALINKGHKVFMGSRTSDNPTARGWAAANGADAFNGTFAEAANYGELIINCTSGVFSLEIISNCGLEKFANKIMIDVSIPADFSGGMPPVLTICNTTSLGEEIQRLLPDTKVVKALNTVTVEAMTNPLLFNDGNIDLLLCGNYITAKKAVSDLFVRDFGWDPACIQDLGGIIQSRAMESMILFFSALAMQSGSWLNAIKIYRV
jgi:8-hydroxy-5-deazaflavin:NADPH oxidoreductase